MHKRHAFCRELFFCRARAPGPLAAFLGLLLAGLSASVALGQELDWARRAGGFGRDDGKDPDGDVDDPRRLACLDAGWPG